jgi:nucleotide-binding universal stress UspA family protein
MVQGHPGGFPTTVRTPRDLVENQDMTGSNPDGNGSIIVGVDGSPSSEHAVMWAAVEAGLQHRNLTLVHAEPRIPANEMAWLSSAGIPPRRINEQIHAEAEQVVARARALAAAHSPDEAIDTVVEALDARSLLLDLGSRAAMTVVGTRGHGRVAGLLLGSVSGALVRHATSPVVVVRPVPSPRRGVLSAADASEESQGTVEHAYYEASLHGTPLTVVHCLWDGLMAPNPWADVSPTDPEGEEARLRLAQATAGMREKFPDVDMTVRVTRGAIDACLVDLSADHDLLVIGRPQRPLLHRLTTSGLTLPVAEHARCPVMVVP